MENLIVSSEELKFKSPSLTLMFGPTNCGKSFLITELLLNEKEVFASPIETFYYVYLFWQVINFLREFAVIFLKKINFQGKISNFEGQIRQTNPLC